MYSDVWALFMHSDEKFFKPKISYLIFRYWVSEFYNICIFFFFIFMNIFVILNSNIFSSMESIIKKKEL